MILNLVKTKLPNIYNYVLQCYGEESFLNYGNEILKSSEGVQQGDPLGPFLFSLGIQDIVNDMDSPLNCWYLDNGCLGGDPDSVLKDLQKIINGRDSHGLQLNTSKCEMFLVDSLSDAEDLKWRSTSSSSSNNWSLLHNIDLNNIDLDSSSSYSNFWSLSNSSNPSSNGSNICTANLLVVISTSFSRVLFPAVLKPYF